MSKKKSDRILVSSIYTGASAMNLIGSLINENRPAGFQAFLSPPLLLCSPAHAPPRRTKFHQHVSSHPLSRLNGLASQLLRKMGNVLNLKNTLVDSRKVLVMKVSSGVEVISARATKRQLSQSLAELPIPPRSP